MRSLILPRMTPLGFEILTWGSQCFLMYLIEGKLVSYVWHSHESPLKIGRTKSALYPGLSVLGAPRESAISN